MTLHCIRFIISTLAIFYSLQIAKAQGSENCLSIEGAIFNIEPIDPTLLAPNLQTAECLVSKITEYHPYLESKSINFHDDEAIRYRLITGAIISMLENTPAESIAAFRATDNVKVAATLATGASNPQKGVRINSSRILASIVDNTTACVVVDYAWNSVPSSLTDTPQINGRANLLGIASVVAPWSRDRNFAALSALQKKIETDLSDLPKEELQNLTQTENLLDRLDARLSLQTNLEDGNKAPKNYGMISLGAECLNEYNFINPLVKEEFFGPKFPLTNALTVIE